jgi:hypothetical protein
MRLKAQLILEQWINNNAIPTGEVITFDVTNLVASMDKPTLAKLIAEVSKPHGQDLDFLAETAEVLGDHQGPFTVRLDAEELTSFVESGFNSKARYITGIWGHLSPNSGEEVATEIFYDTEEERLVAVYLQTNAALDKWTLASEDFRADLEDSLKNANPDALDNPPDWELDYTDERPYWVPEEARFSL